MKGVPEYLQNRILHFEISLCFVFRTSQSPVNERSRSISASPEHKLDGDIETPATETIVVEQPKTDEDIKKEEEEKERLRIQEEEEAAERERLRLEVQKLEGTIDSGLIHIKDPIKASTAESSASDVSDDDEEDEKVEEEKQSQVTSTETELKSDAPVPKPDTKFLEKENLKKILMEKLYEKQKQENEVGVEPNKVDKINQDKDESQSDDDEQEKANEEDYVDIFADSGDENDIKRGGAEDSVDAEEKEKEEEEPVKMEVDEDDASNKASDEITPVVTEEEQGNKEAIETKEVEKEKNDEEEYEVTLKTLSNIRNQMQDMTKEELEEALRKLPSLNDGEDVPADGRTTPIHLRDIHVPLKSLTEYVQDKRVLYKQCFRNINKKEFKFMLPKYLRGVSNLKL